MGRLLVTGANGFLGSALAAELESADRWSIERHTRDLFDLTDRAAVARALLQQPPEVIVHAAGRTSGAPEALIRDNLLATTLLIEAMSEAAPRAHLILLGSAAEYGPPIGPEPVTEAQPCRPETIYGMAKRATTELALKLARERNLRVLVLRLFNVVGMRMPDSQVLGSFLANAIPSRRLPESARVVKMGPLDAARDFITTRDLAQFVLAAVVREAHGCVLHACSGKGIAVGELVEQLRRAFDPSIRVQTENP